MKDLVEVLESYMIAEEGLISNIKNKFKKKQTSTQPSNKKPAIPYAEYKSQYEPKIKRLRALCKSELPKIFKDPKYKICLKGYTISEDKDEDSPFSDINNFPDITVIWYDYWDMYPNLRNALRGDDPKAPDAAKILETSGPMVTEMTERCAEKIGLQGKAGWGGDWDDGPIYFHIDCDYSGVE